MKSRNITSFLAGCVITTALLSVFSYYILLEHPLPWKNLDTSSPNYDISTFKLTDYSDAESLKTALSSLVSVGDSIENVDNLLVKISGAKRARERHTHEKMRDKNIYVYRYKNIRSYLFDVINPSFASVNGEHRWLVRVEYNDDMEIIEILVLRP